jgi:predicted phosphodiesterase
VWRTVLLAAAGLAALMTVRGDLLADWRIRLHTLVRLDPAASPELVRMDGLTLSIAGSRVKEARPEGIVLRAWAPDPVIRVVEPGENSPITLKIENLPRRLRLDASGPVEETRADLVRTLRFSPGVTRRLAFAVPDREVTFAVLGDTGDDPTFPEAMRVAAADGADFFIHAGDLIYEDVQMPRLERILADAPLPVFVVRGNHDYRNRARIDFMRDLGPPYYSFRMGGASFIVLDNADDYLPWLWPLSTQYRWWASTLGEPRSGPLFVLMHKPVFDRRGGPSHAGMGDRPFGQQLLSDFTRAGVDAVFTGHVHETHLWVENGIPFVVNGEGYQSRTGTARHRMGWVRVRGWEVQIEQVPIWRPGRP